MPAGGAMKKRTAEHRLDFTGADRTRLTCECCNATIVLIDRARRRETLRTLMSRGELGAVALAEAEGL
jgi:hypothetical protein